VKDGTLLADKMDWLLDDVHDSGKCGTHVPTHAPAKAAWLSSLVYRKVESKDQLKGI